MLDLYRSSISFLLSEEISDWKIPDASEYDFCPGLYGLSWLLLNSYDSSSYLLSDRILFFVTGRALCEYWLKDELSWWFDNSSSSSSTLTASPMSCIRRIDSKYENKSYFIYFWTGRRHHRQWTHRGPCWGSLSNGSPHESWAFRRASDQSRALNRVIWTWWQ